MVAQRMPAEADPITHLVFIVRTGALFPVYRTFSLLEQLKGRVIAPTILFYPGEVSLSAGAAKLEDRRWHSAAPPRN